jgi:acylphosphatase
MGSIHLIISGKVQGVFYRASAKEMAEKFNIRGWVKNTKGGNVEILACGMEDDLEQFLQWCKKGPEGAIVTHVEVKKSDENCQNEFKIIR